MMRVALVLMFGFVLFVSIGCGDDDDKDDSRRGFGGSADAGGVGGGGGEGGAGSGATGGSAGMDAGTAGVDAGTAGVDAGTAGGENGSSGSDGAQAGSGGDAAGSGGSSGSSALPDAWEPRVPVGCPSAVRVSCGDGTLDPREQCDDGNGDAQDGCNERCEIEEPTGESHPTLILRSGHVSALSAKLGASSISGEVGTALVATLNNQRDDTSIDFVRAALQSGDGGEIHRALLVFDLQHPFMSAAERTEFRAGFLADAEALYDEAVAESTWYYSRRAVNNWTYRHAGYPLQRILYPGLMFRDDSRAQNLRDKGLQLLTWVMEAAPTDGIWDSVNGEFETPPTRADMIDETLATPNSYGLWGAHDLAEIMHIVHLNTDFRPYEKLGCMMYSEGQYWTYLLSFKEGIEWNEYGWTSLVSFTGQTGHGQFDHFGYYSHSYLMHWAHVYQEPVFAWVYYANPSPMQRRTEDYLNEWNTSIDNYASWLDFLDWGRVEPESPEVAAWPLSAFWPEAGVGVIRKQWAKKGPGSGVIWMRAGKGASHDRPATGAVIYHADDAEILKAAPSSYDYDFLTFDAHTNNTLFIDDQGQVGFYSRDAERERQKHGHAIWLGEDTFLMDMSAMRRTDFLSYYAHLPFEVSWTRKVHYHRANDILWIKDAASTDDGADREFRFNWISDATLRANDTYDLPAGYVMVADSDQSIVAEERVYDNTEPLYEYRAIFAGADAPAVRILWAIGKDEAALRAMLAKHRGVFVTAVAFDRKADGVHVLWRTDEPSRGRVEYGNTAELGQEVMETGQPSIEHELVLSGTETGAVFFRVIAQDSHSDETVADNNGDLYRLW